MIRAVAIALATLAGVLVASCAGSTAPAASGPPSAAPATVGGSVVVQPSPSMEATMSASPAASTSFTLTSSAFEAGGAIPRRYGCDGDGVSPPLEWAGVPSGTAEIELLVDDPDARGFVHWVAAGIPPTSTGLAEGATGSSAVPVEGRNGAGRTGWTGPCPPSGMHHYHFTLYAVSKPLGLGASTTADELRAAVKSATIGTAELVGTYAKGG